MNKILLIGNSGLKKNVLNGQTAKVRLYLKKIKDEGIDVNFVDLEEFAKRPLPILRRIKKGIKICDRIVLITAERGCKILIPYINYINKKHKKPFVLPLIGISVLHYSIDKLTDEEKKDFVLNGNYSLCKLNKRISKNLSKITYVLPETDLLTKIFSKFYKINNVVTLNNFRENSVVNKNIIKNKDNIQVAYLSRVMRVKGIFDLLDVIQELIKEGYPIRLDIYGELLLSKEDEILFNKYLDKNIKYFGIVNFNDVVEILSKYDLFAFPTRYTGEGTPGVLSESLIAGTPILTSDFLQASFLLNDGVDSIFYNMFDRDDLKRKLIQTINNKEMLKKITLGAKESGKRFTYKSDRERFLKYVCGVDEY